MSSPVLGASSSGSPGPASSRRCPGDLTAARSSGTHESLCQRRCERDTWLWRQAAHVPLRPAGSVQPRARLVRPPGRPAAAGATLPVAGTSFNRLLIVSARPRGTSGNATHPRDASTPASDADVHRGSPGGLSPRRRPAARGPSPSVLGPVACCHHPAAVPARPLAGCTSILGD